MDLFLSFLAPALVGLFIGILSGMLGIGGGTVMVPIFRLAFGMSALMSTATSLFTIIPTSLSGAISHIRQKTCVFSLGIAAGLGGALTSPFGVWLSAISPEWLVMVTAALVIGYSAVNMLIKAIKMKTASIPTKIEVPVRKRGNAGIPVAYEPERESDAAVEKAAETIIQAAASAKTSAGAEAAAENAIEKEAQTLKLSKKQLAIGFSIGVGAGLASGYIGVGGGFIMIPLMLSFVGISMRRASGTSLVAMIILAIPGAIEQALLGNINYTVGIAVAIGSIPGAVIGAHLVRRIPERTLRFMFSAFLLIAALLLVLNEFSLLG